MSDIAVVEFNEGHKAETLLFALQELDKGCVLDIDDTTIITMNSEGKIEVERSYDPLGQFIASSVIYFGFLGALIGWIFTETLPRGVVFGLQVGVVLGVILGVISARFAAIGVPQDVMEELKTTMKPGSSALFVSARRTFTSDEVLEEMKRFPGKVIRTSLAPEEEAKLKRALAAA